MGDKVRLRTTGQKGTVVGHSGELLSVRIGNDVLTVTYREVTNLSRAARKAWLNMPSRRVGRPKGSSHVSRVSVTLRIDQDLWRAFRELEDGGLVEDRTRLINDWIRQKVEQLQAERENGRADDT